MGLINGSYLGNLIGPAILQPNLPMLPGTPYAAYGPSKIVTSFNQSAVTVNGGIYTWFDQTGNNLNLVSDSSTGLTFSQGTGFTFSGPNSLSRNQPLNLGSNYSIYILANSLSPNKGALFTNGEIVGSPNTGISAGLGGSTHDNNGNNYIGLIQALAWGGGIPFSSAQNVFKTFKTSTQLLLGLNTGTRVLSSTTAPYSVTSGGFYIGKGANSRFYTGSIKSVVVYNYDTVVSGEDTAITTFLSTL